jgi:two-component system response regulator HydG
MREGRILIVSSDNDTCMQLEVALNEADYTVICVSDPARAKLHAHKDPVDMLVIDLTCRDFDGGSLAQELRRVEFSHMIPILFLVRSREKKSRPMRPRFGITDYVTKPFNPDEVVARVRFSLKYGADTKESDREKTVEGSLAEVSLIDLIQIFFQSKKEGYLIVNGE